MIDLAAGSSQWKDNCGFQISINHRFCNNFSRSFLSYVKTVCCRRTMRMNTPRDRATHDFLRRIFLENATAPKVQESSNLLSYGAQRFQNFGSWRYSDLGGTQLFSLIVLTQRSGQHTARRQIAFLSNYNQKIELQQRLLRSRSSLP